MQTILSLFKIRTKEFYRDKGSLSWAVLVAVVLHNLFGMLCLLLWV